MTLFHALSVTKGHAQQTRAVLTERHLFNRKTKICPDLEEQHQERVIVSTNQALDACEKHFNECVLRDVHEQLQALSIDFRPCVTELVRARESNRVSLSPLHVALQKSLQTLNTDIVAQVAREDDRILHHTQLSYNVYDPVLLIGASAFESSGLETLVKALNIEPQSRTNFLKSLCNQMGVTHVAVNASIRAQSDQDRPLCPSQNILRSPSNLQTLYGDFGTHLPPFPEHIPKPTDFDGALWVTCRQNGIAQTWAPLYTMFSQGNVTEKTRILQSPSVQDAVRQGHESKRGSAAVDLFAGIGYFAFSYVKAGVDKVLCWDLNPWSIEGLRRGAAANKWEHAISDPTTSIYEESKVSEEVFMKGALRESTRLLAFCESNINACSRIQELQSASKGALPPIRHINAGMLPSAAMAWATAVLLVDNAFGGWIHLHESILERELQTRVKEITAAVEQTWRESVCDPSSYSIPQQSPRLEHVEKVKSMGPKLTHIVMDFWIPPKL